MRDAAIRAAHRSFMLMERYRARRVPDDALEQRIAAFQHENEVWAQIWRENYAVVERGMCTFRGIASRDRREAATWFLNWYGRLAEPNGVPFRMEAEQFAEVYWRSRG
jgi:hypothetical protein